MHHCDCDPFTASLQTFIDTNQLQREGPLLYNYRPGTASSKVPLALLVPHFNGIMDAAWSGPSPELGAEEVDLNFALRLCGEMSEGYGACRT